MACMVPQLAHATTFYVDSQKGSDSNTGTSRWRPWQSLEAVNSHRFVSGDRILFRAGGVWKGALDLTSSGTEDNPIRVDRYGGGPLPHIDGQGTVEDAVYLHNVQGIELRHLEVTNHGDVSALRRGVDIFLEDFGTSKHIVIADLYIHDVNGTNERKDNGGIIFRTKGPNKPTRFDGLTIERNIVWHVDRSAIAAESSHAMRSRWFPSEHVIIRDNYVEDIGGDGIVPWATDHALVEHNIARYCNHRANSYNAGIWPWSTDNTVLQLNEAAFTQGTRDGEGFDSDYNSRNTLFQYNYSHGNVGGFMLICTPVRRDEKENLGNRGTVVRDNVSRDDHHRLINLSGADDIRVENNVFYLAPGEETQVLLVSKWDGWSEDALFRRNVFYSEGTPVYGHEAKRSEDGIYTVADGWGPAKNIRFVDNRFVGQSAVAPDQGAGVVDRTGPIPAFPTGEPSFDPASPDAYDKFIRRHRKWMTQMIQKVTGTRIVLAK